MEDLRKNKLFWVVVAVTLLNIVFFSHRIIVSNATENVIEQIRKPYSPSPYGPGIDVDKFAPIDDQQVSFKIEDVDKKINKMEVVRGNWETDRGFSQPQ